MTRWVLSKAALAALYLGYVVVQIGPSWLVLLVALASATGVLLADGPARAIAVRGALAAGTLVLSILHARALSDQSPWSALQLGLAAAVAASSVTTLLAVRTDGRAATSLVLTSAVGLAVLASGALTPLGVGLVALAALRPFGAVGVVTRRLGWHDGPPDPQLWWSPLSAEVRP